MPAEQTLSKPPQSMTAPPLDATPHKESDDTAQPTTDSGTQTAALAPAGQPKPSRPDYAWLSEVMARWIQDLDKRYPAALRAEGVHGKVTLTAMLHEDGLLTDVRIAKSSGNAMLDEVAVEDVKKGAPVKLSRPLDRPQMPIKFSITYDLKSAR